MFVAILKLDKHYMQAQFPFIVVHVPPLRQVIPQLDDGCVGVGT